ncbi:hypothetical protein HYPSUDRAFT_33914 [Hypholoma sublateritium FD-334 SS-4]|uniref:Copper transporter n=1 Tax=Hypholoma sublateritium (strain FD-334 SS-4) TaxID=945553 RepID=A0A0D2QA38_HYPSF|nr:hypothetical protein HYPSUDRAFT_33914 [Hypholoma sublateritium FD-334 SS-4]
MSFEPHLHWSFDNEHILLSSLILNSFANFFVAAIIVAAICLSERLLSFLLDTDWAPRRLGHSRFSSSLWRTGLYAFTTFLRLCYMLVAMSCHMGLIIIIVTTLSLAQFFIELRKQPKTSQSLRRNMDDATHYIHDSASQPLLDQDEGRQYPPKSMPVQTRPRSKSKPDAIFIHPTESNIARADAAALEMGLAGDTELVKGHSYMKEEPAWEIGKGKDLAREMLVGAKKNPPPPREPFFIGDEYDSD